MNPAAATDGAGISLGLFLSGQHPPSVRAADAVAMHAEQVALARDLGFSSVWAGQHFLSDPFQMFQSVPLLARMAAEAGDMTIGTGISLLTLLNPVEVAEQVATLDAISGGRFVFGVGFGYRPVENAAFGLGRGRTDLFELKLEVVKRLLAGEAVTAEGDGFRLDGARLSLAPGSPPPVWIAANADKAVRRAARMGDTWFINPHTKLDELDRQMTIFREERAAAGLPPATVTPIIRRSAWPTRMPRRWRRRGRTSRASTRRTSTGGRARSSPMATRCAATSTSSRAAGASSSGRRRRAPRSCASMWTAWASTTSRAACSGPACRNPTCSAPCACSRTRSSRP